MKLGVPVVLAMAVCALFAKAAGAADIGDKAAPLKIKSWAKGQPVDLKSGKGKNVFVIEFWATWCGPCIQSIPHLTELQKKFKDDGVIIVGVSDESMDLVGPFVEGMGDKMNYTVAVDDSQETHAHYMGAYGQNGIPTAFVVDKQGRIAWVGSPFANLDEVVEQVVKDEFDIKAFKAEFGAVAKLEEYFKLAAEPKKSKRMRELAKEIVSDAGNNPMLMNEFAWQIMTNKNVKHRDLTAAMIAAKRAYKSTDGKDVGIIDTYARALFMKGKIKEAVLEQQKAIELCQDPRMKAELEKTLKEYKEKA